MAGTRITSIVRLVVTRYNYIIIYAIGTLCVELQEHKI